MSQPLQVTPVKWPSFVLGVVILPYGSLVMGSAACPQEVSSATTSGEEAATLLVVLEVSADRQSAQGLRRCASLLLLREDCQVFPYQLPERLCVLRPCTLLALWNAVSASALSLDV